MALTGATFGQAEDILGALGLGAIPEGLAGESAGLEYDLSLLSGNKTAQDAAIAPSVNKAVAGSAAKRRNIAESGTARGGGVNAVNQQASDIPTAAAVDALTTLAPQAAGAAASTGGSIAGLGETATSTVAGNELTHRGQSLGFASSLIGDATGALRPGGSGEPSAPGGGTAAPTPPPPPPPPAAPAAATLPNQTGTSDLFNLTSEATDPSQVGLFQ